MRLNSKLGLIIASIIIVAALGTTIIYNAVSNNEIKDDQTNEEQNDNEQNDPDEDQIEVVNLPNLKNKAQFVSLLKENQDLQNKMYGFRNGGMMVDDMVFAEADMAAEESVAGDGANTSDYSGTNNQVAGVDEGDSIKTDGQYFYKITGYGESVQIIDADPNQMSVVQTISLPSDHWVNSLFLSNGKLVLIANYYEYPEYEGESLVEEDYAYSMIWYGGDEYTKVFVYDITNVTAPVLEQEYQFKGYYLSGRTIGNTLYFVTNEYMYYDWYTIFEDDMVIEDDMVLPSYKDCLTDEETELEYEDICYFPGAVEPSYMNTVAIDLSNPGGTPDFKSYLG